MRSRTSGIKEAGSNDLNKCGALLAVRRLFSSCLWFNGSMEDPSNPSDARLVQMPTVDPHNIHWMLSAKLEVAEIVEVRPTALALTVVMILRTPWHFKLFFLTTQRGSVPFPCSCLMNRKGLW